jgi:hypothetical protein
MYHRRWKFGVTTVDLSASNWTNIVDGWGFDPDPNTGAYNAPPYHLVCFRGGDRMERGRRRRDGRVGREGKVWRGKNERGGSES